MSFSIRDWQKASLVRLLTHSSSLTSSGAGLDDGSSSGTSAGGLLDTAWSDDWKVLLYDSYTKAILSPLLTVAELRACGVTLHLPLESPRDSIPDVSAVYLISPSPTSIRLLSEDSATGRYRDCSVFVTPSLPRPQLETLAAACVQSGSVPRIARLLDAYSSFVALQPKLFTSIGLHGSLTSFASPSAGEREVNAFADSVTSSLVSLCATVGFTPIIVCSRGGPAEMVARQLESALRDHLASPTAPLFSSNSTGASSGGVGSSMAEGLGGSGGTGGVGAAAQEALIRSILQGRRPLSLGVGPGSRPVLIILDRTIDLATPLSHGSSYESLVDECVGPIEGNRVVLPGGSSATSSGSAGTTTVTLAELDEYHPSRTVGANSSGGAGAGSGLSGTGAGAWLLDWAAGKSSTGGDVGSGASASLSPAGKTLTLDPDSDPFWSRYCRTVIPEAIEAHERELTEVVAKEQEIRRKAGAAAASLGAAGDASGLENLMMRTDSDGGNGADPSSLSSAIESLPALLKRKKTLEVHTSLLQAVWQRVVARMLPHLYEQELPWLAQPFGSAGYHSAFSNDAKAAFYQVLSGKAGDKGTHLDRLRLAAIFLLTVPPALAGSASSPAAPSAPTPAASASSALGEEAEHLLSLLVSSSPSPAFAGYAASVLGYIRSLRTSPSLLSASAPHLLTLGGATSSGPTGGMASAAGGLLSSLINKGLQQVSRLVEGANEQRLPITTIASAICDGKPSMAAPFAVEQYLTLDPRGAGSRERTFGTYLAAISAANAASGAVGGAAGSGGMGAAGTAGAVGATSGPASFRNAFVYVVGGCTYNEAADLQNWASGGSSSNGTNPASGPGGASSEGPSGVFRTVVLGGTEIISPVSFLSQLRELGKDCALHLPSSTSASVSAYSIAPRGAAR